MEYYLRGAVYNHVYITYSKDGQSWFLNTISSDELRFELYDPNRIQNIASFTLVLTGQGKFKMYIPGTSGTRYLTGLTLDSSDNTIATLSDQSTLLNIVTTQVNSYTPYPLAGVEYTISLPSGNIIEFSQNGSTALVKNIRFLPNRIYPAGSCDKIISGARVLQIESHWSRTSMDLINQNITLVNDEDIDLYPITSFTTIGDCRTGIFFTYCPLGINCGGGPSSMNGSSPGCRGPCPNDDNILPIQASPEFSLCSYDPFIMDYKCITNEEITDIRILGLIINIIILIALIGAAIWSPMSVILIFIIIFSIILLFSILNFIYYHL